jgi:superfamily II DNA or RNA helicase
MKIFIKNLSSRIETDNPRLLKALVDRYTHSIPGANYSNAYKRGHWDGKKYFIHPRTGEFKTGLLDLVLADLKLIECEPELIYEEPIEPNIKLQDHTFDGWDLHDYQEALVGQALDNKRCVIKSPTGSGKTLIMASVIKAFGPQAKILCLFTKKQLINQTYEFLVKKSPAGVELTKTKEFSVGVSFSEGFEYGNIMLCSVYSLERLIGTPHERPDILIVDECHEFSKGKLTSEAISSFPTAKYRIGFTATPPTEAIPKYTLHGGLGPVITEVDTSSLIERGMLARPYVQILPLHTSADDHLDMDYRTVYDNYIVNNGTRNQAITSIVETVKAKTPAAKVLILVNSLEHGQNLMQKIPEAKYLQGSDDLRERNKIIKDFKTKNEFKVLIGTKILETGVNIPEITHFINARGLFSEIATIQALGRALRLNDFSEKVYVYDFYDEVKYLSTHSRKRKSTYKNQGHVIEVLPRIEY